MPIYWAFLTFMLLTPGSDNQQLVFVFNGIDKIIHILIFLALGFLFRGSFPKISFLIYIGVLLGYAILTELIQEAMQLGRSGEVLDLIADLVGLLLGYYLFDKSKSSILKYLDGKNIDE